MIKLKPQRFADYLSLISFIGFVLIALKFGNIIDLTESMTGIFLIGAGFAMITAGNLLRIHKWARDGIQGDQEVLWLATSLLGVFSIASGGALVFGLGLENPKIQTLILFSAIFSAIFTFIQYVKRRKRC